VVADDDVLLHHRRLGTTAAPDAAVTSLVVEVVIMNVQILHTTDQPQVVTAAPSTGRAHTIVVPEPQSCVEVFDLDLLTDAEVLNHCWTIRLDSGAGLSHCSSIHSVRRRHRNRE